MSYGRPGRSRHIQTLVGHGLNDWLPFHGFDSSARATPTTGAGCAHARAGRRPSSMIHFVCMKRTNLVLDERLLEEATRLSGERTYSRAVERALEEFVKRIKARQILGLAGSGLWEGDLSVVREDRGVYRTRKRGSR